MKILVVCQYYYPEPFRINDICEELVKRGHEVEVVTGEPNYPEGYIYKGYENHLRKDETINGVKVHRCPIIPRRSGVLYRLLNYFSYPYQAKQYIQRIITSEKRTFDLVFVYQLSPIMMAEPAIMCKKMCQIPVIMYCLDLWPESLIAGGVTRDSIVYRFFYLLSNKIYKSADRILITSRMFRDYLEEQFLIENDIIEYLPQYAEDLFENLPYKKTDKEINLVFAGNIGEIQSVETIIAAAARIKNKNVHFHIVGGGTDLERLKSIGGKLANVTFYGRRPIDEMPKFYSVADAMLVTLKADPILSLTLPGKVQSYMAAGKPIIGAIDGEASEVIKDAQCGFCGKAENVDELVNNIEEFIYSPIKEEMGRNARAYYEQKFKRSIFMDRLERVMSSFLGEQSK